jgi:hypothetical protein
MINWPEAMMWSMIAFSAALGVFAMFYTGDISILSNNKTQEKRDDKYPSWIRSNSYGRMWIDTSDPAWQEMFKKQISEMMGTEAYKRIKRNQNKKGKA